MSSIAPLDTAFGLSCVAGNETLYRKLLGKFMDQQSGTPQEIEKALAAGDIELAHRLAHTLKGVAASLGLPALQQTASAVDAAFKAGDNPASLLAALADDMSNTIQTVTTWLETTAS